MSLCHMSIINYSDVNNSKIFVILNMVAHQKLEEAMKYNVIMNYVFKALNYVPGRFPYTSPRCSPTLLPACQGFPTCHVHSLASLPA